MVKKPIIKSAIQITCNTSTTVNVYRKIVIERMSERTRDRAGFERSDATSAI